MRWSTLRFGKYEGKTLPEIIIRDADWFFWALPKLYGKLAEEGQELARKAQAIEIPKRYGRIWKLNIGLTSTTGFAGLHSSKLRVGIAMDNEAFASRLGVASSWEEV